MKVSRKGTWTRLQRTCLLIKRVRLMHQPEEKVQGSYSKLSVPGGPLKLKRSNWKVLWISKSNTITDKLRILSINMLTWAASGCSLTHSLPLDLIERRLVRMQIKAESLERERETGKWTRGIIKWTLRRTGSCLNRYLLLGSGVPVLCQVTWVNRTSICPLGLWTGDLFIWPFIALFPPHPDLNVTVHWVDVRVSPIKCACQVSSFELFSRWFQVICCRIICIF